MSNLDPLSVFATVPVSFSLTSLSTSTVQETVAMRRCEFRKNV